MVFIFFFLQSKYRFLKEEEAKISSIEISEFRRALPQFLAVSVKNILLFGNFTIITLIKINHL